jgi:integrase
MQKGTILKRGKWWLVQCRERVNIAGQMESRTIYKRLALVESNPTRRELREKADAAMLPINAARTPEIIDTVETFLEGVYMPHVRETLKLATVNNYNQIYRDIQRHPEFTKKPLRAIRTADCGRLLEAFAAEKTNRGTLRSQAAINQMRAFLSGAFNYAVLYEMIETSPISRALATPEGIESEETYAYTLAEIRTMLDAVADPMAKTAMLTAALTGLRKGEIAGLQWSDIEGNRLHVQRNVYKGHVDTVKTKGSKGHVPLLPVLADALEAQRARNGQFEYIFHSADGGPASFDLMASQVIVPALKRAGLAWHGWHGFRRGVATNLRELGVRIEDASAILRHANTAITLDFYAKARPEFTQAAMAKLEQAFTAVAKPRKLKTA